MTKNEQNLTWSEEDEMIALSIEQVMNCASLLNIVPEKIDKIRTWLKSIKDRVGCEIDFTTKKSYTDIEQSKKLAEILPLESADAFYPWRELMKDYDSIYVPEKMLLSDIGQDDICAWSLVALLNVLPKGTRLLKSATDDTYHCDCPKGSIDKWFNNPVDACVEMILKLHELMKL